MRVATSGSRTNSSSRKRATTGSKPGTGTSGCGGGAGAPGGTVTPSLAGHQPGAVREHDRPVRGDRDRVLHVDAPRPIAGTDRPAVLVHPDRPVAGEEPGLDRDHEAGPQLEPAAGLAPVRDVGRLVHRV